MNDDGWKYDEDWQRGYREGTTPVKKYPSILGEPVYIDPQLWPPPLLVGEKVQPLATKAQLAYQQKIDKITDVKWELLFWMYGIDPKEHGPAAGWERLARALVGQHVPGFTVTNDPSPQPKPLPVGRPKKRGRGRPPKYTIDDHFNRVMQVKREEAELARKHPDWPAQRLTRRAVKNLQAYFPDQWPESKVGKPNLDSAVQLFYDSWDALIAYAVKNGRMYEPYTPLAQLGMTPDQRPTIDDGFANMLRNRRGLFKFRNDMTPSEFRHGLKQLDGTASRYIEAARHRVREGRRMIKDDGHKHPETKVKSAIAAVDGLERKIREFEEALGKIGS